MSIRIQDCVHCNQQPMLTCEIDKGGHVYNLAHKCPDGTVARGARYHLRDEVIKQWNSDQIEIAMRPVRHD